MELTSGHFLCYRGRHEKTEHGVGFIIPREIAGHVEEFFSIKEGVTAVVIKLKKRYRLQIVQAYTAIIRYDDEAVDSFYEDVESAVKKKTTQFTIVMVDFNAKIGKNKSERGEWETSK